MSQQTTSPTLSDTVEEVQGVFPSNAALEDAIARLTLAGFDRAAFSLPTTNPVAGQVTPDAGAADPMTDTDVRQARTLGTSMAGYVGAFAAAGATIATGGLAGVAIAAAAAVGGGAALAAHAAGGAIADASATSRDEAAAAGHLVLSVHAPTAQRRDDAERLMREAGATEARSVSRVNAEVKGIDSSSWTG